MAQHNLRNSPMQMGISKAHVVAGSDPKSSDDVTTPGDYQSIADLDSALQTADNVLYTNAYLDSLTKNDKVFALKLINDSGNYGMV